MSEATMTAEELRAEIARQRELLAEAERELGAATLDGATTAAPARRARNAREAIERAEAALAELDRREQAEQAEAARGAAAAARLEAYEWTARWARAALAVVAAREQLKAAEQALKDAAKRPGGRKVAAPLRTGNIMRGEDATASDLDTDVLYAFGRASAGRGEFGVRDTVREHVTPEDLAALAALAEQRAGEEREGRGTDFAGVPRAR